MKKKLNLVVSICVIFSLVYIFFAVKPLSKEIHFLTKWTIDANKVSPGISNSSDDEKIPFKLGQTAGYFSKDAKILSVFTFPYKAAISQNEYCTYGTNDSKINVYSNEGAKVSEISANGFPYFQKDRKFLMLPGGNSFALLSDDSKILWTYENYVPITAFDSSETAIAAGYADGSVLLFANDGTLEQEFVPGGSEYPVILGVGVSKDAQMVAAVCGQKEQRFVLATKEGKNLKIAFHEYLEAETSSQCLVKFSKDSEHVYFAHKNCLGVVDTKKLNSKHIKIRGNILSINEAQDSRTVFVLSKEKNKYYVSVLQKSNIYAGNFNFTAENAFITVKENSLFVGRNSSISKIDIEFR